LEAEILTHKRFGPYAHLSLRAPDLARRARPGQFVTIRVRGEGAPFWRRPFSICRAAGQNIELLIKGIGPGSQLLCTCRPGETLDVVGPLGQGFALTGQEPRVLVGGGYGMAPLLFLAERLLASGQKVDVLLGGRSEADLLLRHHFRKLKIKTACATEDGSLGKCGPVTELLEKRLRQQAKVKVAACGPKGMLAAVAKLAGQYGVQAEASLEEVMACGLGVCNGCVVKSGGIYRRVCKDGPVFPTSEIEWE
jgi:dihydroorotate dehydrogenase electron transfer subunit